MKRRIAICLAGAFWITEATARLICEHPIFNFGERAEGDLVTHGVCSEE